MPIYEYACQACEHQFETIQKFSDEPLKECPECGKPELRKLVSAVAFRLKGGGWYETDFKSGKKKNVHGEGSGDTSSSSETKTEPKKAESKSEGSSTGGASKQADSSS